MVEIQVKLSGQLVGVKWSTTVSTYITFSANKGNIITSQISDKFFKNYQLGFNMLTQTTPTLTYG